MLQSYLPIVVLFVLAFGFAAVSVAGATVTGPKRYNRAKMDAYECGIEPTPQPMGGGRFPIKFYLTAMLFIVFDIEIIFLYPWAVVVRPARAVRAGRDGPVPRHGVRRVRLRVAPRRARVGLIADQSQEVEKRWASRRSSRAACC